jgi:hypothetical protein
MKHGLLTASNIQTMNTIRAVYIKKNGSRWAALVAVTCGLGMK